MSVDRRWLGIQSDMWVCFRTFFLLITWTKMNGIFHTAGFNRMEPLLIPRDFHWMPSAKHLQDACYLGIGTFFGHTAHLILAPVTSSYGGPEVQSVPRQITHCSRIKRGNITWNCSDSGSNVTNVMRNFNYRLQKYIYAERRHLPEISFHN